MIRPEVLVTAVFVMAVAFYFGCRIFVYSINVSLSVQDQKIANEVAEKESQISKLQTEVNSLQEKNRVLGMLDNEVKDNQNNIYIING